jgi:hypothetical protein
LDFATVKTDNFCDGLQRLAIVAYNNFYFNWLHSGYARRSDWKNLGATLVALVHHLYAARANDVGAAPWHYAMIYPEFGEMKPSQIVAAPCKLGALRGYRKAVHQGQAGREPAIDVSNSGYVRLLDLRHGRPDFH